jgi:hypothetical protein
MTQSSGSCASQRLTGWSASFSRQVRNQPSARARATKASSLGISDEVLEALHPHRGAPVPLLVPDEQDLLGEEAVRGPDHRPDVEGVLAPPDGDPEGVADPVELGPHALEAQSEGGNLRHRLSGAI